MDNESCKKLWEDPMVTEVLDISEETGSGLYPGSDGFGISTAHS